MALSLKKGREARPASTVWNVTKTFLQTSVFWGVFVFAIPPLLVFVETQLGLARFNFASPGWRLAAVILFVVATPLNLSTGLVMAIRGRGTPLPLDCARSLVVEGPYRYVRNPMALGGLALCGAVGLYLGSPLGVLYPIAGGLIWNYGVRPWEEADLLARFGAPFQHYREQVRCWIPRLTPYRPDRR